MNKKSAAMLSRKRRAEQLSAVNYAAGGDMWRFGRLARAALAAVCGNEPLSRRQEAVVRHINRGRPARSPKHIRARQKGREK